MSMFYLFFGIEKKSFVREKILLGVEQNSIDMYVGKNIFERLVKMLPFLNMLVCFIFLLSAIISSNPLLSDILISNWNIHVVSFLFLHLDMKYFARSKIKLIKTDLSFPFTFGYESLHIYIYIYISLLPPVSKKMLSVLHKKWWFGCFRCLHVWFLTSWYYLEHN